MLMETFYSTFVTTNSKEKKQGVTKTWAVMSVYLVLATLKLYMKLIPCNKWWRVKSLRENLQPYRALCCHLWISLPHSASHSPVAISINCRDSPTLRCQQLRIPAKNLMSYNLQCVLQSLVGKQDYGVTGHFWSIIV